MHSRSKLLTIRSMSLLASLCGYPPIAGNPYADSASVDVVDANTVKVTYRKVGRVVESESTVAASDSKTARTEYPDSSSVNSTPVTGANKWVRLAPEQGGAP